MPPKDLLAPNAVTPAPPTADKRDLLAGSEPPSTLSRIAHGVDDYMRSVASGMTGGLADEFGAYMSSVTGIGGQTGDPNATYDENLGAERRRDKDIPWYLQIPGEVAGSVASTVAAAPAIPAKVATAFSQLPGWMRATGLGGLISGIFGFGTSEGGFENRAKSAAVAVPLGMATGAATYGALRGGQKVVSALGDRIRAARDPTGQADRLIGRAMTRDVTSPAKGRTQLREYGPQGMIADIGGETTPGGQIIGGENIADLARNVGNVPGAGKHTLAYRLASRSEGDWLRIKGAVNKYLSPKDFFTSEEQFLEKLQQGAREAYQPAFEANALVPMTPRLKRIMTSPDLQAALKLAARRVTNLRASGEPNAYLGPIDKELTEAARYARELGKLSPDAVDRVGLIKGFSLETWDMIKWGLDRVLESPKYSNELTKQVNRAGYPLQRVTKSLVKELDRATGGENSLYKAARAQYGGDAEVLKALRAGKDFMKLAPEEITKYVEGLSDAAKSAYRSGAARAILDLAGRATEKGSAANRIFSTPGNQAKIQRLFDGKEMFDNFSKVMRREQRFASTAARVGTGSRTAPMLMDAADVDLQRKAGTFGALLGSHSPFGHPLVASRIGRETAMRALRPPSTDVVNQLVASRLSSRNRAANLGTLDRVDQLLRTGKLGGDERARLLAQLIAEGAATQEGRYVRPLIIGGAQAVGQAMSSGQNQSP